MLPAQLAFCVVDEGDSVLIDEARVPLIISGRTDAPVNKYETAYKLAGALERNIHYEVIEKEQNAVLTEEGQRYCEQAGGLIIAEQSREAMRGCTRSVGRMTRPRLTTDLVAAESCS